MTIIVGAGPAGLAAALGLKEPGMILERNAFAGKKLLISGSGQCNLTNDLSARDFLSRLGEFQNFLKPAYYEFDNRRLMQLLADNGCPLVTRKDGKVFPRSLHSADVRNTLLGLVERSGHSIVYNTRIQRISHGPKGFQLYAGAGGSYTASRLILCCGGAAYPETGSDGGGYNLAKELGHTVLEPRPALSSIRIRSFNHFAACAGISLQNVKLKLGKKCYSGDLLFTHHGFSGPLILDHSYRMQIPETIHFGFADPERFEVLLRANSSKKLSRILHLIALPKSLCGAILKELEIEDVQAGNLSARQRNQIIQWLGNAPFEISAIAGFEQAMSDFGGVKLKEVKASSLESSIIKGLFFAGESLAYSLPTGGFSIQMAFSTGYLAGRSCN